MASPYPQSFVGAPAVTGANLGSTVGRIGPFAAKVGDDLQFKSLVPGAGVALAEGANDITFTATRTNVVLTSAGGTSIVASGSGPALLLKGLIAGAGAAVTPTGATVTIANSTEANTASNLGSGAQVFSAKVGVDLRFRSIAASSGVTVTQDAPAAGEILVTSAISGGGLLNLPWEFREEQPSGVATTYALSSPAPTTRRINTTSVGSNPSTDVQLAVAPAGAFQLRIVDGTYWVHATSYGLRCDSHQIALYNVTDATYVIYGTSEHVQPSGGLTAVSASRSLIDGVFTVAGGPKVYELRHFCFTGSLTPTTTGLIVSAPGRPEIYSAVTIMKVT